MVYGNACQQQSVVLQVQHAADTQEYAKLQAAISLAMLEQATMMEQVERYVNCLHMSCWTDWIGCSRRQAVSLSFPRLGERRTTKDPGRKNHPGTSLNLLVPQVTTILLVEDLDFQHGSHLLKA